MKTLDKSARLFVYLREIANILSLAVIKYPNKFDVFLLAYSYLCPNIILHVNENRNIFSLDAQDLSSVRQN